MDSDVAVFGQVMVVIVMSTFSFVMIGFLGQFMGRRGSRQHSSERAASLPRDDERLERLETAVDAIAIEVERISESQRFMVGLLSESLPAGRAERAQLGRVVTPR
jgi:hypothetical protein